MAATLDEPSAGWTKILGTKPKPEIANVILGVVSEAEARIRTINHQLRF